MLLEMIKSVLFGMVEGITEWLPIRSTGHLILVDQFVKLKEVWYDAFCIDQLYWQRYRSGHTGADSKSCYPH